MVRDHVYTLGIEESQIADPETRELRSHTQHAKRELRELASGIETC